MPDPETATPATPETDPGTAHLNPQLSVILDRVTDLEQKDKIKALMLKMRKAQERGKAKMLAKGKREKVMMTMSPKDYNEAQKILQEILGMNVEVVNELLEYMRKEFEGSSHRSTYKDMPSYLGEILEPIENKLDELEEIIFAPPPDPEDGTRNPLYYKNNPNHPYFGKIGIYEQKLVEMRNTLKTEVPEVYQSAVEERITRAEEYLNMLKSKNPIGLARYNHFKEAEPSMIAKPTKLVLLGGAGLMFAMSAVTVGKKLAGGEDLELPDALVVGYGLAALKLAGVDILASKTDYDTVVKVASYIESDADLKELIQKRMDPDLVIAAMEEVSGLLKEPEKRTALKKAIKKPEVTEEFVKEFADGDKENPLVKALCKDNIKNVDRKRFLSMLYILDVEKDINLSAVASTFLAR